LLLALGAPTGRDGLPRRPDAKTITEALALHGVDYDRARPSGRSSRATRTAIGRRKI
jgi:hypothetical protein